MNAHQERRWPHDSEVWPVRWNRAEGLEALCLAHLHAYGGSARICEVGVANGVSTAVFEQYGTVDAYDIQLWGGALERFKNSDRVTLIQSDSLAAADVCPDGFYDIIYLDSRHDHEWVRDEIRAWLPKVKPGGFIAGHDYSPEFPGVQQAVAQTLGGPDHVYADSSWICAVS